MEGMVLSSLEILVGLAGIGTVLYAIWLRTK